MALFAGNRVPDQPPADDLSVGDPVVRLGCPADPTYALPGNCATDVEMLPAHRGGWRRVGLWRGIDDRWPVIVAPTDAVMGLRGGIADLLDAGLAHIGPLLTDALDDRTGRCRGRATGACAERTAPDGPCVLVTVG